MRQQLTRTAVIALSLGAAIALVVAGAAYFAEYQHWDASGMSFTYRERPLSGVVFAASLGAAVVVLLLGGLVATRIGPAARLHARQR